MAVRSSRRRFLATTTVAASTVFAVPSILRARGANERLNIAVIGVSGRGGGNLGSVAGLGENIVALCDVDTNLLGRAAEKFPDARKETDFRKLYDHAKEFDAVVVSTAEHTHAFATLPALKLGKHVYCEKPLTHNIWEARKIREAAAQAKVATQMGIQIHEGDNFRRVVELVRSGAIGKVSEVHVWTSRAWGWQSPEDAAKYGDIVSTQERPKVEEPVPSGLNWDLWLGPAAMRPYNSVYTPGPKWYRWWDFGSGTMSDLGSHMNDLPFWALDLDAPKTIEAFGPPPHVDLAPASMHVTYTYGPRGDRPGVSLTWYQGVDKPKIWTDGGIPNAQKDWDYGMLFVGDKGMLISDYFKHKLLPEKQYEGFTPPPQTIEKSKGQHAEWVHAAKTGAPTLCNFEYSGWLTEANHLGNVAYRVGKKLEWDPTSMKCPGTPEADKYIKREYRQGWELA